MKKKWTAIVLAIGMVFSITACGGKGGAGTGDAPKLDYANMTEDDLIKEFIKDETNVTTEEYLNLLSTYSYVDITEDLNLNMDNITRKAVQKLKDNDAKLPKFGEYVEPLLKSDSPQLRGYAFSNMRSILGTDKEYLKMAKEVIKTEKEPFVIKNAIIALQNDGAKDEEIREFIYKQAENENPAVRAAVAGALGNSHYENIDGALEIVLKLMNDPENKVRDSAYRYAGSLRNDQVVEPIAEMLKNEDDVSLHSSGIEGLIRLWYDYPLHRNTSEKAYRATMDYLNTSSDNGRIPVWHAVQSFHQKSEKNYDQWREKATYFDPNEVYEIMVKIVKNDNLDELTRKYTSMPVAAHCTKEQFEEFGKIIDGLKDDDAESIKEKYEIEASELE